MDITKYYVTFQLLQIPKRNKQKTQCKYLISGYSNFVCLRFPIMHHGHDDDDDDGGGA